MDAVKATEVLETLRRLQSRHEISIIKLSEPITSPTPQETRQRASDASNASPDGPTPASLEADLAHYTELFAKLRFSYVEQVTKEKFIRAIVGDPPMIVTMQENLDLEKENGEAKARLKSLKLEVADMVTELERKGRELSQRYERVQTETAQLEELPAKIQELEAQVEDLRAAHEFPGSDPSLNLPLAKTLGLVAKRKAEQQELARELEALQAKAPRKRKEAERLQAELQPLEMRVQNSTAAAREAQRRKEAALGGVADDQEQRARWWRASEGVLKQVLDIKD
ncbi:Kinetochore protein Sos7 [Tolypocladium capitatum]|uniref:Kinetochore protein Sos7 n=1 Tax=Tolypocladium capitatum TaxID=45235 RepID=A0A2K3QA43_9HYPO|nr:Kinetochore protein Sos7 [Tolypocladium capitatum]